MIKIHTKDWLLTVNETDFDRNWRPSAILGAAQVMASEHSDMLGCGVDDLAKIDATWILFRQTYQMDKYPKIGDTVKISTWPGKPQFTVMPRYFTFESPDGELYGKAHTLWFIVNFNTKKMLTASKTGYAIPDVDDLPKLLPQPEKIEFPGSVSYKTQRIVRFSDLDYNHHMNNMRYLEWICDLFPTSHFENNCFANWQINYLAAAKPDEEITMELSESGSGFFIRGYRTADNQEIFAAKGNWQY